MIKSLLEPDEPDSQKKTENASENIEDSAVLDLPPQENSAKVEEIPMVEPLPENPAQRNELNSASGENQAFRTNDELERKLSEIERMSETEIEKLLEDDDLLRDSELVSAYDTQVESRDYANESKIETVTSIPREVYNEAAAPPQNPNYAPPAPFDQPEVKPFETTPESRAETIRQSGMAWSAAIALFGSILFFMIIGWFADVLLGTTPWSLVAGILLGGILGFIQFFRITSQIFRPQKNEFEKTSLKANENAEIAENPPANNSFLP